MPRINGNQITPGTVISPMAASGSREDNAVKPARACVNQVELKILSSAQTQRTLPRRQTVETILSNQDFSFLSHKAMRFLHDLETYEQIELERIGLASGRLSFRKA